MNLGTAAFCKMKGSLTTSLDYDCGKHLRKEHGMGLAQESPSCFKRALSWSGVTMSFIATSGRWFCDRHLNLAVVLTLATSSSHDLAILYERKKLFSLFLALLFGVFFFSLNLLSVVFLGDPRYRGREKWFSDVCFFAQFMINYLLSSDVFSKLKSVRQLISPEMKAINVEIKVSFYKGTTWVWKQVCLWDFTCETSGDWQLWTMFWTYGTHFAGLAGARDHFRPSLFHEVLTWPWAGERVVWDRGEE